MTKEELRQQFHNEQSLEWQNSLSNPSIDYMLWLEDRLLTIKNAREVIEEVNKCLNEEDES